MKTNIVWHCPGCGDVITDLHRTSAVADFPCRCGVYNWSDYLIGMPDAIMPDAEARDLLRREIGGEEQADAH